ncbi:hypothetical protein RhiirA1_471028 [Rhizophagus irregularis]|uniref:Uncharacterized protein n=1 Tax=Rhizophagus irregularis TaxID=588596 RepID=A0A2N0R534_9GLOM|nr:hypothetical protein RhiirA1_471028 [Rhizophagus irregularis]
MGIIHPKLQNDQPPQSTSNTFSSKRNEDISSENTRDLRNFLQVTIKSRYSNSESNINSIKTCIDENKMNYCETMPGYSMHCVGNLQKIELYVPTDVDQSEILSQSRIAPLSQFIYMLKDLADVFKVTPKAIHIFYDNSVNSIAFNLGDVARKTVITIKNHSKQILDKHSVYFYSGTSDWGIPGPVSNCEGLVWGMHQSNKKVI